MTTWFCTGRSRGWGRLCSKRSGIADIAQPTGVSAITAAVGKDKLQLAALTAGLQASLFAEPGLARLARATETAADRVLCEGVSTRLHLLQLAWSAHCSAKVEGNSTIQCSTKLTASN